MGVLLLTAVVLRAIGLMAADQQEGTNMKQNGLGNWTTKAFLACTETIWALMVDFAAGVLAA